MMLVEGCGGEQRGHGRTPGPAGEIDNSKMRSRGSHARDHSHHFLLDTRSLPHSTLSLSYPTHPP